MKGPRVLVRTGHRGKPDLPVQAIVIRADDTRSPERVARLAFEFVRFPLGLGSHHRIVAAFKDNLVSFLPYTSEGPIGVDEMQGIKGSIHGLPA